MTAQEQLPAVVEKITRMLAVKPEYFVTHPSELRVGRALGGRQIEFYKDAKVSFQPM
jgi:hypothetical protein